MDEVYFNVAKNGLHLFRTDKYCDSQAIQDIEIALASAFRKVDGYKITKTRRPAIMYSSDIAN